MEAVGGSGARPQWRLWDARIVTRGEFKSIAGWKKGIRGGKQASKTVKSQKRALDINANGLPWRKTVTPVFVQTVFRHGTPFIKP